MKNGSFNVCFFSEFYTVATTWVVRAPIETAVHDAWGKLQSEVHTMQYIRAHTILPIPRVYAYGRAPLRHGQATEQTCYTMMEHMDGEPLDTKFLESPIEHQRRFYADFIDVLAQLRGLEFHAAGSLMPRQPGDLSSEPAIISAISIPVNELYTEGGYTTTSPPPPSPPPTSANGFIA